MTEFFVFVSFFCSSSFKFHRIARVSWRFPSVLGSYAEQLPKYLHTPEARFHLFTTAEQTFNILALT